MPPQVIRGFSIRYFFLAHTSCSTKTIRTSKSLLITNMPILPYLEHNLKGLAVFKSYTINQFFTAKISNMLQPHISGAYTFVCLLCLHTELTANCCSSAIAILIRHSVIIQLGSIPWSLSDTKSVVTPLLLAFIQRGLQAIHTRHFIVAKWS